MDKRFAGLLAIIGGQPIRGSFTEDYRTRRSCTTLTTTNGVAGRLVQHGPNLMQVAKVVDPKEMFK